MLTLLEISEIVNGEVIGSDAVEITNISSLSEATSCSLSFFHDRRQADRLMRSQAGAILLKSEHADLFGSELSYWQGLLIKIRPDIPSNIAAGVTSLSLNGTTGTIQLSGGPNTVYQCHFSSDLTAFSEIATNPTVVRTNSNGTTSFTIETTDDKGFVILEIAP